jgi:hypothetical protein
VLRGKRAAKEAAAASGKRGRGRKRKSPAPAAGAKAKRTRRSEVEVAEDEIAASGLGNHCSILQFPSGSDEVGVIT